MDMQMVFGLHVDDENADEYVPSRWDHPTQAQKDSFMLFSAGKQNCVGQSLAQAELHCIVPRILSEVELEVEEEGTITWFLTLKPIGARLKAKRVKATTAISAVR
jgi:cytochrome P450